MHRHRPFASALVLAAVVGLVAVPQGVVASRDERVATATPAGPAPQAISATVDLGQYGVNGPVRAAVVDAATGVTYIGGAFTLVGRRTGQVAVVDPPGTSDGPIRADSPEVLGRVVAVFGDDRPGDPGLFVVGRIAAIDGVKVSSSPVHRLHRVGGDWVRDTGWAVNGQCHTGTANWPIDGAWIETPTRLIFAGLAGPGSMGGSTTGLTVIDRVTGHMTIVGGDGCGAETMLPAVPQLPGLTSCAAQVYCSAWAGMPAVDPASGWVIVPYHFAVGSADPAQYDAIAAYDLADGTGGRRWFTLAQASTSRGGSVMALGTLPGSVLVRGILPLDAGMTDEQAFTRLMRLDAATGAILQRWSYQGEQDLTDGGVMNPATPCETSDWTPTSEFARIGDEAFGWVGPGSTLCRYGIGSGGLISEPVADVTLAWEQGRRMPAQPYVDGATTYLVGTHAAVDLTTGELADWHPAPAVRTDGWTPAVAALDGSIVIGGDFSFARGTAMPSLAALDSAFAPFAGFSSPLAATTNAHEGVEALAFAGGKLVVGGASIRDGSSLVAVDPATGAVDWAPADPLPTRVDSLAVGPDGDLWVTGLGGADSAVVHFGPLADGATRLPAPTMGCLDAPVLVGHEPSSPTCLPDWAGASRVRSVLVDVAGRVYLAGAFGTVDGIARRGLARLTAEGAVDTWDPDLLGVLPVPEPAGLMELDPYSLAVLGDRLVVGGRFSFVEPNPNGGAFIRGISSLLVFSTTTGTLLRPTDPARQAWFPLGGWDVVAHDMLHTDAGLVVAFGDPGMGIFDATTLDLDETASAPYLDPVWWLPTYQNAIYALAMPGSSAGTLTAQAVGGPGKLVIAGAIGRWNLRVAGNVLRTTIGADTAAPITTGPRAVPRAGASLTSASVPVRVLWTGTDTHGSGVASYDLAVSVSGGAYTTVKSGITTPGVEAVFASGKTYRYRVRARDFAGNVGAWTSGATLSGSLVQQTSTAIRYSTGWTTLTNGSYSGGTARARSIQGAAASYTFTGRGVALITTLGPTRGKVKVYVDGSYIRTLDLYASSTRYRAVAWAWGWATSGTHTIRLVVMGTFGRPRVEVDAFAVIR